jgi:hypothetical protein
MAAETSTKRRKIDDSATNTVDVDCLSDLPSGILTHVATYLASPTSRALFAVALATDQNAASADERNSAIIGDEWDMLNFGDIEKELAEKLSDEHIKKVLVCIDAVNKVKRLKLTNCVNITGAGSEPLRGSTIIQQIDLSLVGKNQSPLLTPQPPISCELVLPILDSIIEREGSALMHLQFPSVWSEGWQGRSQQFQFFEQFLRRYNEMLDNRGGVSCLKCNTNLPPENNRGENGSWIDFSGGCRNQKYTCCECLKHYCESCEDSDDEGVFKTLRYCQKCKRRLCADCTKMGWCEVCENWFCVGCDPCTVCPGDCCDYMCNECITNRGKQCSNCERHVCGDCASWFSCGMFFCGDCPRYDWRYCGLCLCPVCLCDDCNEKRGIDALRFCEDCQEWRCSACRVLHLQDQEKKRNKNCTGCLESAGPFLFKEHMKISQDLTECKTEVKGLQDENERLSDQVESLKEQVKELEEKIKSLTNTA